MADNGPSPTPQFLAPPAVTALRQEARNINPVMTRSHSEDMREEREDLREAAEQTLTLAIQAAIRGSDPRMAATARINLARVMRATGQRDAARALLRQCDDWYRTAGGGDGALLTRALLAATSDSDDADLEAIVDQACLAGDHEAEVVMLDALALRVARRGQLATARHLLATADDAALAAVTVVDDVDRLDAHRARELLSGERQALSAPSPGPGRDTRPVRRKIFRTERSGCPLIPPGHPAPGSARYRSSPGTPPAARRRYPAAVRSGSRAGSG